jgi:hypothetical protein
MRPDDTRTVRVHVRGLIPDEWNDWFAGIELQRTSAGDTVLTGNVTDQAALFGLLTAIRDLGLQVIEVTVTPETR